MIRMLMAILAFAGFLTTPASAIVGDGEIAKDPALVMILSRSGGAGGFCTAIVLSKNILLTAAHCVTDPSSLRVFFQEDDGSHQLREIARSLRHPGFRADAVTARKPSVDLALLQTKDPLPERFSAASIGEAAIALGSPLDILGFGVAAENQPKTSGRLRRAQTLLRAPLSQLLLWLEGSSGACTGDSGGPVYFQKRVVGIIAFAAGSNHKRCGSLTQAIRLSPYQEWIEETIRKWSGSAHPEFQ